MPNIVFNNITNYLSESKYPFSDEATLTDTTGKITLPNNFLVDASMYLPASNGPVYLSSITRSFGSVTITFSVKGSAYSCNTVYDATGSATEDIVGDGSITDRHNGKDLAWDSTFSHTELPLYTNNMLCGVIIPGAGTLQYLHDLSDGIYTFNYKSTQLVPSCVMTLPNNFVRSIRVEDSKPTNILSGDVWFIGCNGVQLRTDPDVPNSVRIDVVGDAMYEKAGKNLETYSIDPPLETINGFTADDYGNFSITTTGESALRIQSDNTGIKIYLAGI